MTLARSSDIVFARETAMKAMAKIGASAVKRTKFVTAVSEIARNAIIYGGGGAISFRIEGVAPTIRVVAECKDGGPGIADMDLALKDGYTTGSGLGLGLSGARRLVDRFNIVSSSKTGTTVTLESYAR
ncbi:ATP-binding protein [Consotaella salsifontis]|uniref:Serine/threonine-protein kinase RsbT n=1 Tax=Consotaella salsifontis TaxID=1365950 RepID=A0A1T4M880_9HYPH|nr:ATP-binding protein [Consotaella salsifontis]SJZ63056.1 serine/threonine-protein kinase RsbT [Consotaella salsifontis]